MRYRQFTSVIGKRGYPRGQYTGGAVDSLLREQVQIVVPSAPGVYDRGEIGSDGVGVAVVVLTHSKGKLESGHRRTDDHAVAPGLTPDRGFAMRSKRINEGLSIFGKHREEGRDPRLEQVHFLSTKEY